MLPAALLQEIDPVARQAFRMADRVAGQGLGHDKEPIGRQRARDDEHAVVRPAVPEVIDRETNEIVPVARDQAASVLLGDSGPRRDGISRPSYGQRGMLSMKPLLAPARIQGNAPVDFIAVGGVIAERRIPLALGSSAHGREILPGGLGQIFDGLGDFRGNSQAFLNCCHDAFHAFP